MRVLVLTQHFAPEITAGRFRVQAFARALIERGHEVQLLCPVPNHPKGRVHPEYRGRLRTERRVDGIRVDYLWVHTSPAKTFANRIGYYGSYAAIATVMGSAARRPDVIFASSPPLPVAAAAAAVAARHRVPWVFDVRDIWPDVAVALGELTHPSLVRLTARLERRLYRSAARVVTVTEPFRRDIAERADDPAKVVLVPNGTTRAWIAAGRRSPERSSAGLPDDRFVWTYAGNIGLSHGLETAVDAAARLDDDYQLLIVGDGPLRASLEHSAEQLPARSVAFREPMQVVEAARALRASDALLVMQRGDLTKVVSSKLYDCCAVGRPVIVVGQGEISRLVEAAGAGLVVATEDPVAVAGAVRRLREDDRLRERLVANGRRFAADHLREEQGVRVAELLESVAAGSDG